MDLRALYEIDKKDSKLPNGSSFPEAAVYFYVKQIFEDARYRDLYDVRYNREFDIYIPSIKTVIEYNGSQYHNTLDKWAKDYEKYEYCKKKHLKMIHITEKDSIWFNKNCEGIDFYNETNIKVITRDKDSDKCLAECITELFDKYLKTSVPDIDLTRDRSNIITTARQRFSFEYKCPEYAKYWDYEKNGTLKPSDVSYSFREFVWFKCSEGKSFFFTPAYVSKYGIDYYCKSKYQCENCILGDGPLVPWKEIRSR